MITKVRSFPRRFQHATKAAYGVERAARKAQDAIAKARQVTGDDKGGEVKESRKGKKEKSKELARKETDC